MLVEKHRPRSLSEVLGHKKVLESLRGYVAKREMPNILFTGKPGTGKTAVSYALGYELDLIPDGWLELNASSERGINVVRETIKNFAKTKAITKVGFKAILLDEADYLTKPAQAALRRVMEQYSKTVRFILTCNAMNKLIPALRSRCAIYNMRGLHPAHMRTLLIRVEQKEGKLMPEPINQAIVKIVHGDARLALNILEAILSIENPTPEDVYGLVGIVDESNVWSMMFSALKGKMTALDKMNELVKAGASAVELINTMYWTAMKGTARGMTEEKRLRILTSIGFIPGSSDEMRLTSILGRIILDSRGGE